MGGQTQFMRARKMRRRRGWTKIRDEILRRKKVYCLVERSAIFGCKKELARIDSCYVFLHYTSDYMMVGFVLWLKLGLIKG